MILGEKLSRIESEKEQLQEDYSRMKQGESFLKISPHSPSVGIGDRSFEEVTAPTVAVKEYTEREKELILKNGELSFRLKELVKAHQALKEVKEDLVQTCEVFLNTFILSCNNRNILWSKLRTLIDH